MKPKINLTIDKTTVTEGDVVEVSWSCSPADSVQLTLDNGYKSNAIPVENSGSKKFRLNRSKGRTHIVVGAMVGDKTYYNSVKVRVKKLKVTKTENVYDYTGAKGVRRNGLRTTWENYKAKMKMVWSYMPENKRLAYKILSALAVLMIISSFWPQFLTWGLLIVGGYLFWFILKR